MYMLPDSEYQWCDEPQRQEKRQPKMNMRPVRD